MCSSDLLLAEPSRRWKAVTLVLTCAPPLLCLLVGGLERLKIIDMHPGAHYWDFTISRTVHCLFGAPLYLPRNPILYLLLLATIMGFAMRDAPVPNRIKPVNRLFAAQGLGMFLLYLLGTEARWSIVANIMVPLRFDSLLGPLLLMNLVAVVFFRDENAPLDTPRTTIFASLLAIPFILILYNITPYMGVWYAPAQIGRAHV